MSGDVSTGEANRTHEPDRQNGGLARCLVRGGLACVAIAAAETVHGVLRGLFLVPVVGDLPARQIGVFSGSLIILFIAYVLSDWIRARTRREQLGVGLLWLALMLSFEVGVGRAFGFPWERIVADYLPWEGGFMIAGMTILFLAPLLAARLRSARKA